MTYDCAATGAAATDLVTGRIDEPERSAVLQHLAGCEACRSLVASLADAADALLELAPEVEPPPGFENRTVTRMGGAPIVDRPRRRRVAAALAAAAVVVLAATALTAWTTTRSSPSSPEAAAVTTSDGGLLARAIVRDEPSPHIVIAIASDDPWEGVWTCEVTDGDGRWVAVGAWTADEMTNGVWAAGLPDGVTDPASMRILGSSGRVIATASMRQD